MTHKKHRSKDTLGRESAPGLLPDIQGARSPYRLAKKLAKMRLIAGINQTQMAHLLNCSQPRISYLETSHNDKIPLKDIQDYSKATGINVDIKIRRGKITFTILDQNISTPL